MKHIHSIIVLCLILFLGTSCENDGFYYQDEPRVRMEGPEIWTLGTDSLEFSFVTTPSDITEKTMDVTLYIMGMTTEYDRTVLLEANTEKTTADKSLYDFPTSVTIPANANQAICTVTLKRADILQEQTVRLYIQTVANEDFAIGNNEQNHILIKWNDILSKPNNWNELEEFFGSYSDTKYRFMLNNAGVSEFSTETMSWAELQSYKIKLTNALNEYNQAHPGNPLRDENNQLVNFDN